MKALTEQSTKNYAKLLKNIIDLPLLEIFLDIGIDLIELYPEEQYIQYLIEEMQEKHTIDSIEELNMKFRQVQDFYNDCIASYENIDMYEPEKEKLSDIEKVVQMLMSLQDNDTNATILKSAFVESVESIAYEYGFMDALYEMEESDFKQYLKREVFGGGAESLYVNFLNIFEIRNTLINEEAYDEHVLYVQTLMLVINISVFNMIRKERFVLAQEQENKKVGRNEPCPCGSGKKYKKCCGK